MKKLLLTSLVFVSICVNAQFIQQSLYSYLPQSSYQNIGSFSQHKGYFGIPFLGYNNLSIANSGFAFNDFVNDNGAVTLSAVEDVLGGMDQIEYMDFNYKNELLNLGFSSGENNFFTINLASTLEFSSTYSKDFLAISMLGTGASNSFGTSYDLSGTSYNLVAYNELGFGYQRKVNDQLSFGARIKYLSGILNSSAYYNNVALEVDPNTNEISTQSNVIVHDYGVSEIFLDEEDLTGEKNTIPNFSNNGIGFDFGASYKVDEKLSFSFNAIDIGKISWKNGRYKTNDPSNNSDYEGLDLDQLHKDSTGILGAFQEVQGMFEFNEVRKNYSTNLPTSIYLGAEYLLSENLVVNGLLCGKIINGKFYPSYTVAGGFQIHKKLQTKLSYSVINNTYTNIGLGFVGNLGPFQLFVLADNLPGVFNMLNTRYMNLSFGLNIAVFRDKDSTESSTDTAE